MDKLNANPVASTAGGVTRRELLKTSGQIIAASALAGIALPQHVYAGETNTVQLALVGAGGRGTGAAQNALSTKLGPVKLAAMADVFPERLKLCHQSLSDQF